MSTVKFSEVVRKYPNLQPYHTGGGCMALRHDLGNGGYLLVTSDEGAYIPDDTDTVVLCGVYPPDCDAEPVCEDIAVVDLESWLDKALGFAECAS